jgi:endonuclease VIII
MPEGPSMLIANEEMSKAIGQKVVKVLGNSQVPIQKLKGQTLKDIGTWGKHLLFFFNKDTLKIHFLLFGSYSINTPKDKRQSRLELHFKSIKIYFYACSVQFLKGHVEEIYDWTKDILSLSWDSEKALKKMQAKPNTMVCDILMDQDIFAGVGNIIKNEVLFNLNLRPERKISSLTTKQQKNLIEEAHSYYWKKNYELKKHWNVMRKKYCEVCGGPVTKEVTGKFKRLSHYCKTCQK